MPKLISIIDPNENKAIELSWRNEAFPHCCGANIISGVSAVGTKETGGFGKQGFYPTLREVYTGLDALSDRAWQDNFTSPGFTVITDQVNRPVDREKNLDLFDKPDDPLKAYSFGTKDFVEYLISRKKGTVVRGPYTENTVHRGNSVVVAWIWVPDNKLLLEPSAAVFGIPEKLLTTYPHLADVAKKHAAREQELPAKNIAPVPIPAKKKEVKKNDPFSGEYRAHTAVEYYRYANRAVDLAYADVGNDYNRWAALAGDKRNFLINKHIVVLADQDKEKKVA